MASAPDGLESFLPVVARWFRATYGEPTPPQRLGWPSIAAGRSTLIFAPTGSGKTLAAFLACLDLLWRTPGRSRGVRVLYVSPLKALNQDVERNLRVPLGGVETEAAASGEPLTPITVGVRSGDTTPAERQRLLRRPPDVLITTPESLHLLLTSRGRDSLRTVTHVILDEIHAVCPNKRGVFLALLMERLEALTGRSLVRVGLSATQRPLEEVARYLGGREIVPGPDGRPEFRERAVTIVDAGRRKQLDLGVIAPFGHAAAPRVGSVWPVIEERLLELIRSHRSTIVFANNRRVAERLTSRLNERAADPNDPAGGAEIAAEGLEDEPFARSHHGSLSLEERRSTEEALKQGELAAVVATASLELGIDMGAVDLVCQVESPGSIARALQRVGRAGHLVGRVSKGRLIAKTASDLIESAALCREMEHGQVEVLRVPTNCLDVLAQQVVACVAVEKWDVASLFRLVRQSYPYRDLTAEAFESVLKMVSGRFPVGELRDLRARVSWDRVHNRLAALPGSSRLVLTGGGTIPDTGQYPVYLGEDGPRLGELDEEFVLERRVGETFVLGSSTWRIDAIEPHRVVVGRAEGHQAVMPFWRGESVHRTAELGQAVGSLCRELAGRIDESPDATVDWLAAGYGLERPSAQVLRDHVARQIRVAGAVPDDRTVLVESFVDPAGETGLAVLTSFGGRLHQSLKIALVGRLRRRLGLVPAALHDDEGVLIRLPRTESPPLDLFNGLTAADAETIIRDELGETALFGLRFRQNAGRALLLPRPDPSRRTPLWLQRLRAKDLLQVLRNHPDFPVVVETYRECLDDDLDLGRLRQFFDAIGTGDIRVVTRNGEVASPFVSDLLFRFEHTYLYEWDDPKSAAAPSRSPGVDADLLDGLLAAEGAGRWLDPAAVGRVESRLRGHGRPPRTVEEMAEALRRLGDLAPSELVGPMAAFLDELAGDGRVLRLELPGTAEPVRWVAAEDGPVYAEAFPTRSTSRRQPLDAGNAAAESVVRRYLQNHALVGLSDLLARYPIDPAVATELLERWSDAGGLVRIEPADPEDGPRWAERGNLAEVRRLSVALRRRESVAVAPEVYADFLLRRQGVHPEQRREGEVAFGLVLEQLAGLALPADLWESEVFPARVRDYRPGWLDDTLATGDWTWRAEADGRSTPRVAFLPRDFPLGVGSDPPPELSEAGRSVLDLLESRGACFVTDLARWSGLEPSVVRGALEELTRLGLVANDRFDPLRPAGRAATTATAPATVPTGSLPRPGRPRFRRPQSTRPDGRWSALGGSASPTDAETLAGVWAGVLLDRYGVLTRETAALDPWAPAWRDLVPWLTRAELRQEVRRGFFVEGLSGVQYATDEAAQTLARSAPSASAGQPSLVMVSSLDPANVYGSGAPFDVPLLEGGTARLPRNEANSLVLCAGRVVLIIEAHGRRLTGLSSASEEELKGAVRLVATLARAGRRVVKVETYNGAATLASTAAPWLAEAGFVRDHPGMALYAGW